MSTTTNRSKDGTEKEFLKKILGYAEELKEVGPSIWRAVQDLSLAIAYKDTVLRQSALASIWLALRDLLQDCISEWIGESDRIKNILSKALAEMRGQCFEGSDADEFARIIVNAIDDVLKQWTEVLSIAVGYREKGYDILNMKEFRLEIANLEALKEKFSKDWPWSQLWNPPLDKEMVERSRAAYESGECEEIDDLLGRLKATA